MRLVAVESLFEEEGEEKSADAGDTKVIDCIDAQVQRHMGDIQKIRIMYNGVVRECWDTPEVKQAFMERLEKMIHASDEGEDQEGEPERDDAKSSEAGG